MTDVGGARPQFSPTITLLTLSRSVEEQMTALLKPHQLTVRKYGVLGHIHAMPGISYSELARRSSITVQSVHALIASLVQAGWVDSAVDSSGLAARLTVTERGERMLDQIAAEVAELDRSAFSAPELAALADVLERIVRVRMQQIHPPS
jgi:DNA-binding MarR family transcriptional regulator